VKARPVAGVRCSVTLGPRSPGRWVPLVMKDRDHFNSTHQDAVIHIVREPLNADAADVSIDWRVEFRRLADSIQSDLHLLNELFAPAGMEIGARMQPRRTHAQRSD
jgi:hypothetical protein